MNEKRLYKKSVKEPNEGIYLEESDEGCKTCTFEVDMSKCPEGLLKFAKDFEEKFDRHFKCLVCHCKTAYTLNGGPIFGPNDKNLKK